MNISSLLNISNKYKNKGIKKGAEFLMPPDKIILLIDDLANYGVLIAGCDLWRFVDKEKGWIVQLVGAGFSIGNVQTPVLKAAALVKQFILVELPSDAELVSLVYFDMSIYDAFR